MPAAISEDEGTILVTGAKGFVGSSLVASWLKIGASVVAFSSRDPQGTRAREAVEAAAAAFDFKLSPCVLRERLRIVSGPADGAPDALTEEVLREVTTAWHLAASPSNDARDLPRSLEANVAIPAQLYLHVARRAPRCRRFYHFSTAYAAGFPEAGTLIAEGLHPFPCQPTAFQLTKWAAEMSLRTLAIETPLPVTVLRPPMIVGHSRTGAYHGRPTGIYFVFAAGRDLFAFSRFRRLRLAPETNGLVNLLPIDALVGNCLALESCPDGHRPHFEVFQMAGTEVPLASVAKSGGEIFGIEITFDGPRTAIDHLFGDAVRELRAFATHSFRFEERALPAVLGERFVTAIVDSAMVDRLVRAYAERLEHEKSLLPLHSRFLRPWLKLLRTRLLPNRPAEPC